MSSSSTTQSPNPSPSDNSFQQQRNINQNSSSQLYLVTFLATLFLLLFVSCAIILRSYVLRRRYQRRLEEAVAAGLVLTPRAPSSRQARFGVKPKMFEFWFKNGAEQWVDIQPIAAQPIFVKRKCKDVPLTKTSDLGQRLASFSEPLITAPTNNLGVRLWRQFRQHQESAAPNEREDSGRPVEIVPAHATLCPCSQGPVHYKVRVEMLQVATLIAMPSPNRARRKTSFDMTENENEELLPELALGVTRAPQRLLKTVDEIMPTSPPAVR